MRRLGLLALVLLFVLHQDFWLWSDASIVLGLPVGLTYHIGLCILASVVFLGLVRSYLASDDRSDV
jgi:hypothetical protein